MTVAEGSFDVGSGGDYADWATALGDIAATLTDDLTLTQISAIAAETGMAAPQSVALGGFTLTCTSDAPHRGDPTAGWIASLAGASDSLTLFDIAVTGTGKLDVSNFNVRRTGTPTSSTIMKIDSAGPDVDVHDCIAISEESSGSVACLQVQDGSGASGSTDIHVWNCASAGGAIGQSYSLGYTAVMVVENCTASASDVCIEANLNAIVFVNCVAIGNTATADFNQHSAADGTNCASEDASATDGNWSSGTNNIPSVTVANEFVSLLTSNSAWLQVKAGAGGALDDGGAATTITENTAGIRTNLRPGNDTFYSVGSDELVENPTVTSVLPNDGAAAGGTAVSVGGTLFASGATAKFGGVLATSVVFVGATELTCVTPAGTGVVDVVVTNVDTGAGTLAGGFSYLGGVGTQTAVEVPANIGEGASNISRSSPGLGDMLNKVSDNLDFIKEASQQDDFAEFKLAMEDLDALTASPRPRYMTPYPAEVVTVQIPERFGDGRRLSRAEASRLQGLLDVLVRVSEILEGIKSASQEADFATFKTSVAALPLLTKSNDSRI